MYTFLHSCGKVYILSRKKSMCGHFFREEKANMRYTTRYNHWKGFLQFMHVNPFQSQVKWNKRNHPLGPFIWNRVTSPLVLRCLIYTSVKCKCWGTKANLEPLLNLGSNELFNIVRDFRGEQDPEREKVRHRGIGAESRARALWADQGLYAPN